MRFASLGSGSRGNGLLVESGATRVLLDCGFGIRDAVRRLERLGVSPDSLDAVLVTHEHGDHVGGVFSLARRYSIPVWLTHGTHAVSGKRAGDYAGIEMIDSHAEHAIGDLGIIPFPVPHDAREPVQYVFTDGGRRLGVLTDCGSLTPHVESMLDACDAIVLECNHDPEMLAASSYPAALKRRISGRLGHLDNREAASLLQRIEVSRLQHVIAAHLSEQNNRPELAIAALARALGCEEGWIGVADQEEGFSWREIR